MHEETIKAVQQVEEATGKPIEIRTTSMLAYAVIKAARQGYDKHILYYNELYKDYLDYLIIHECQHILRMWTVEEHQRLIPTSNQIILETFKESRNLPAIVLSSIMAQLTSLPTDIQIEKTIYEEYPLIRTIQLATILNIAKQSWKLLPLPYDEINIMNYAYLYKTGRILQKNLVKPYSNHPNIISKGKSLLKHKTINNDHLGDIHRINTWTKALNLSGLISWSPFSYIPEHYYDLTA